METDWSAFFNGLLALVVGILGWIHTRKGYRSADTAADAKSVGSTHVELAGALVDSTSLLALAGSIEGHSLGLTETRSEGKKVVAAVEGLREAVEKLGEILIDHRDEVRELRHEMRARR